MKNAILRKILRVVSSPILNRIKPMEGLHKGAECYIFGDGHSLKFASLGHLSDRIGIAVGVVPARSDFSLSDTRYWILPEPFFFWPFSPKGRYPSRNNRRIIQKFYNPKTFVPDSTKRLLSVTNFPWGFKRNTYYFLDFFPGFRGLLGDVKGTGRFAGSVNASISLAIYLGFKRAYLVGFDYTHNPPMAKHWYEYGEPEGVDLVDYNRDFFKTMSNEIELITVTLEDQDTFLPSITYKELTGEDLVYKENFELLRPDQLKALSAWPDYSVFPTD